MPDGTDLVAAEPNEDAPKVEIAAAEPKPGLPKLELPKVGCDLLTPG